jgi:outer membrane protein TolC
MRPASKPTATFRLAAIFLLGVGSYAQPVSLTLADALRFAEGRSEQVAIARAVERSAVAEEVRARAQLFPLLQGSFSYTRTLASQFSSAFGAEESGPPQACPPLTVDPTAPIEQRVAEVERVLNCPPDGFFGLGGDAFRNLPFGRTNIWQTGFSFSQALYTGGRISALRRQAAFGTRAASIQADSTNAQFQLDVTEAFYNAGLAEDLVVAAQAAVQQAEKTLEFVRLGFSVGRLPEFEVLRAAVALGNQSPIVTRSEAARREAYLRLKQLLELPPSTEISVNAELASIDLPVPAPFADRFRNAQPLTGIEDRAPLRQAAEEVQQREAGIRLARSQRFPSINLVSQYGLIAYPSSFLPTARDQVRNDWTVGVSLQVPLLEFGRIRADEIAAGAALEQSLSQRKLTRELAVLDTHIAVNQLQAAQEEWKASAGVVDQAVRAYEIAELRYEQGISTQLELNDVRIALLQARINRSEAARNLQIARATVALIRDLPLNPARTSPASRAASQGMPGGRANAGAVQGLSGISGQPASPVPVIGGAAAGANLNNPRLAPSLNPGGPP